MKIIENLTIIKITKDFHRKQGKILWLENNVQFGTFIHWTRENYIHDEDNLPLPRNITILRRITLKAVFQLWISKTRNEVDLSVLHLKSPRISTSPVTLTKRALTVLPGTPRQHLEEFCWRLSQHLTALQHPRLHRIVRSARVVAPFIIAAFHRSTVAPRSRR